MGDTAASNRKSNTKFYWKPDNYIFFITGVPGIGKTTFLKAVVRYFNLQPSGFITKKDVQTGNLYIHSMYKGCVTYSYTADTCAGICKSPAPKGFPAVFDSWGVEVLTQAQKQLNQEAGHTNDITGTFKDSLRFSKMCIIMDELGCMENGASFFCDAVMHTLKGYPVIGVVKPTGTMFLPIILSYPHAVVVHLTEQNRPLLYQILTQSEDFGAFLHDISSVSCRNTSSERAVSAYGDM